MTLDRLEKLVVNDGRVAEIIFKDGIEQRPIWQSLELLQPNYQLKWVDRISHLESLACEWALAKAYEDAFNIAVPERAEFIRALLAELQRMLWGFDYFYRIFISIEDTIHMEQALRLREYLFQGQEIFTGSRILPQMLTLGGVERDFSVGDIRKFKELLKGIDFELRLFFRDLNHDILFEKRLKNSLAINKSTLEKANWKGPIAQAAGIAYDLRADQPYGAYKHVAVKHFNADKDEADGFSRVQSVLFQIRQSINLCYHFLSTLPEGAYQAEFKLENVKVQKDIIAKVEGASGPVNAYVTSSSVKIETTSMRAQPYLETLLWGGLAEDIDLNIATLGYSFAEADIR